MGVRWLGWTGERAVQWAEKGAIPLRLADLGMRAGEWAGQWVWPGAGGLP